MFKRVFLTTLIVLSFAPVLAEEVQVKETYKLNGQIEYDDNPVETIYLDETIDNIDLNELNCTTYTDQSNLSYRYDGNNVDINTENVELAKNQLKYYTLMNSMTQEFSRLKTALRTS